MLKKSNRRVRILGKSFKKIIAVSLTAVIMLGIEACKKEEVQTYKDNKLTYWVALNPNAATTVSEYGETPFSKALQERLGVEIEYEHPPQGQTSEKFNIMISMGELPDIIEYQWMNYPGGPAKALSDNVIQQLDIKEKAPNLYSYIEGNKEVDNLIKTDDGKYFGFPFIRGDRILQTSAGIIIRQDWLDSLGLEMPQTVDDWDNVLKAFKEQKGAKYPLSYNASFADYGAFVGAYGTIDGLYIDDGKVKYGALEPGYKQFVAKMNEWYEAGYIPTDYATMDSKAVDANIINGFSGATVGSVGSGIGRWTAAATEDGHKLAGAPYPVLERGQKPEFGQMQLVTPGVFTAISRDCKNIDLAMKVLDYGYSEEGRMLYNFGIEGESYEMIDGYPTYTDIITDNPDGLSMSAAMARYIQAYDAGPFIQDKRYIEQYSRLPEQKEAFTVWSDTNMENHLAPNISLTPKDSEVMAKKIVSINTYAEEQITKFIMGLEPVDNYDSFVEELKVRGVEEYLELMQAAYERFLNR